MNVKKEIEYEEAPCGYVTLYNYKEPFMPYKEGYGYQGVLVFDGESDKVQCHLCGNWYMALGPHLIKEHNMRVAQYKEEVGLANTTALIGEKLRAKMISNGQNRFKNLTTPKVITQETRDKISATLKDVRRERQNITGTCPLQLIDRLQNKAKKLGRCPTSREIGYAQTLSSVYGSFSAACKIAGLTPQKSGQSLPRDPKYSLNDLVTLVRDFWVENKRMPKYKDLGNRMWNHYKKRKKEVQKQVLFGEGAYQKTGLRIYASKKELLDILRNFKYSHGRDASVSDCKRGLLPHASRYYYHFGSLKKAIALV